MSNIFALLFITKMLLNQTLMMICSKLCIGCIYVALRSIFGIHLNISPPPLTLSAQTCEPSDLLFSYNAKQMLKLQGHLVLVCFVRWHPTLKPRVERRTVSTRLRHRFPRAGLAISANSLRFAMQMLRRLCVLYLNLAKGGRANKRS